MPGDRAVVDDAARALLHHDGCRVLHAEHHRAHQQRHGRIEAFHGHGGDAARRRRTAGIVEDIVEPRAERLGGFADHPFPVVLERGVGADEQRVGAELLRQRLSQLDLASGAEISTRHLSFLETGRALPSRDMVLHLAEQLEVPLRERNILLVAAGFAPVFAERSLQDPVLQAARKAVDLVLAGHEPYPALAVDRHWTLVSHNAAIPPLLAGAAAKLLQPPVNVLRLSLLPEGLAALIRYLVRWR